jgi:DNA sulfur modification protein DndD
MRITRVKLYNYRQYKECVYSFPNGERDVHLFIGLNTRGKSNLLNAINWCLYNEEPHTKDKNRTLPIANLDVLKDIDLGDEVTVEVIVDLQNDEDQTVQFKRTTRLTRVEEGFPIPVKDNKLKVYVQSVGDKWAVMEGAQAETTVEIYFPRGIRDIFFFDGELLSNYFKESTSKRIKDTITVVSKIQMLEVIVSRLGLMYEKKRKDASRNSPDLKRIEKELENLSKELIEVEISIEKSHEQLIKAIEEKAILDEKLRTAPNIEEDEREYRELKKRTEECKELRKLKEVKFNQVALEYIVLQHLHCDMSDLKSTINDLRSRNQLPPPVNSELLVQIIKDNKCKICDTVLDEAKKNMVIKLLDSITCKSNMVDLLMEQGNQVTSNLNAFDKNISYKDEIVSEIQKLNDLIKNLDIQSQELDKKINLIPDREDIKNSWIRRRVLEDFITRENRLLGAKGSEKKGLDELLESKQKEFKKALSKQDIANTLVTEMNFCAELLKVAKQAKDELIEETRNDVRKKTNEHFLKLNWVSDKYTEVLLSSDYELNVLHKSGYCGIGSCSGSETALLTLSYILALHELTNLSSPLLIDTPTYNMTGDNKTNFAEVLSEISQSKQIILMLTPTEFSSELQRVFIPNHSTLKQIENENNSSVLKEYTNA